MVVDALDQIEIPTCIASGGSHEKMRLTLGLTGLWDRFDGRIYSASEVARPKPAPDLFLYAAATSEVDPTRYIVVEGVTLVQDPDRVLEVTPIPWDPHADPVQPPHTPEPPRL